MAPSQSGQVAQAREAPLLAVTAAVSIAASAVTQARAESRPTAGARVGASRLRTKRNSMVVKTSSAVPRWRATDHGLFRSSTVKRPRPAWTTRRRISRAAAQASAGCLPARAKASTASSRTSGPRITPATSR